MKKTIITNFDGVAEFTLNPKPKAKYISVKAEIPVNNKDKTRALRTVRSDIPDTIRILRSRN